jgi:hypothetical protein
MSLGCRTAAPVPSELRESCPAKVGGVHIYKIHGVSWAVSEFWTSISGADQSRPSPRRKQPKKCLGFCMGQKVSWTQRLDSRYQACSDGVATVYMAPFRARLSVHFMGIGAPFQPGSGKGRKRGEG